MGLRLVRPNSQRGWSLRQEGIKLKAKCLFSRNTSFEIRTYLFSLPLPSSERIQKEVVPSTALKDPYLVHSSCLIIGYKKNGVPTSCARVYGDNQVLNPYLLVRLKYLEGNMKFAWEKILLWVQKKGRMQLRIQYNHSAYFSLTSTLITSVHTFFFLWSFFSFLCDLTCFLFKSSKYFSLE